jgi:hypothetical protein
VTESVAVLTCFVAVLVGSCRLATDMNSRPLSGRRHSAITLP